MRTSKEKKKWYERRKKLSKRNKKKKKYSIYIHVTKERMLYCLGQKTIVQHFVLKL